jgi:hypothetical protein
LSMLRGSSSTPLCRPIRKVVGACTQRQQRHTWVGGVVLATAAVPLDPRIQAHSLAGSLLLFYPSSLHPGVRGWNRCSVDVTGTDFTCFIGGAVLCNMTVVLC